MFFDVMKKQSIYKISDNLYCCECGKTFTKYQLLNAHLSHCKIHHIVVGKEMKLRPSEKYKTMCWDNKSSEEIASIYKKSGNTLSNNLKTGKTKPSFKGKTHTIDVRDKLRIYQGERSKMLIQKGYKINYNKNACSYINELNNKMGWNLQHAENGGEIECCGYWLDGYDKEKNIVFEYDERKHYADLENNILTDADKHRQNIIIKKLNCAFYRYNEVTKTLYRVN